MIDAIAVVAFSALMFTGSTMFLLTLMGKRLPFLPCDHKWKMVSAKEVEPNGGIVAAMTGSQPLTCALFECTRCPEVKTEVMPGPFAVDLNELGGSSRIKWVSFGTLLPRAPERQIMATCSSVSAASVSATSRASKTPTSTCPA